MEDLEETVRALVDHADVQGGVLLAHTALVSSVISVFKAKGLISQDDVNSIYDFAMVAAETSTVITAETSNHARRILEMMAGEMAGTLRRD